MEPIFFFCLIALALVVFWLGLIERAGYLTLPFLSSAVYLGWMIPQIWSVRHSNVLLVDSLSDFEAQCILCLIAIVVGWHIGTRSQQSVPVTPQYSSSQFQLYINATAVVTCVVLASVLMIAAYPAEAQAATMWTGPLTILYFISSLKSTSLFMSLVAYFRRKSPLTVLLFVVNLSFYFIAIVIYFRRRSISEAALAVLLACWVYKRATIPRAIVIGGLIVGALAVFAVGDLRGLFVDSDGNLVVASFEKVASIDFIGSSPLAKKSAAVEVQNAIYLIHMCNSFDFHTFGAQSWNNFIFQFVPGQLIGYDLKQSLMLDTGLSGLLRRDTAYELSTGTTITGIGEGYVEFGHLGCIFFLVTAVIVGRYWRKLNSGVWGSVYYAAAITPALLMITAYSAYFFVAFTLYWIALGILRRIGHDRRDLRNNFVAVT